MNSIATFLTTRETSSSVASSTEDPLLKILREHRAQLVESMERHRTLGYALGCGMERMRIEALDEYATKKGLKL